MTSEPIAVSVLFVDGGNSCLSIMAEAIFNHLAPQGWLASSAGFQPAKDVHLRVVSKTNHSWGKISAAVLTVKPLFMILNERTAPVYEAIVTEHALKPIVVSDASWMESIHNPIRFDSTRPNRPDDTAFIQFSSGSTSRPKGICLSHFNIAHNLEAMKERFNLSVPGKIVGWLPLMLTK